MEGQLILIKLFKRKNRVIFPLLDNSFGNNKVFNKNPV